MKVKKLVALGMCTALAIFAVSGCGKDEKPAGQEGSNDSVVESTEESTAEQSQESGQESEDARTVSDDPMEMITQGRYVYSYPVEGMDDMTYFFHFYEEQPGLGNVYYAGFALNQITFSGTWTIEETPCDYACYDGRDAEALTEGTAPYTVTFYDWDGNVVDSCGFDGQVLYEDMETITGVGGSPNFYRFDADVENSDYAAVYQAEAGVTVYDFEADEDASSTITLYHNGSYLDMVNMMVEGTWSMEQSQEGYQFVLTPESDTDTAATLSVSADKATAVYQPEGGEEVKMHNKASAGPAVSMVLKGSVPMPDMGIDVEILGNLYEDGTCDLTMSAGGMEMPLDAGTYSMGEDGYTVTFVFETAGEIASYIGESGAAIDYTQAGTAIGDIETTLVISFPEG